MTRSFLLTSSQKYHYIPASPMVVHLSRLSYQPDIQILCTGNWVQPVWSGSEKHSNLPEGVYEDTENNLYTFQEGLTTCPDCTKKSAEQPTPDTMP